MDERVTTGTSPGGGEAAGLPANWQTTEDRLAAETTDSEVRTTEDVSPRQGNEVQPEQRPHPGLLPAGEGTEYDAPEDTEQIPSSAELLLEQAAQLVELRAALAAAERRVGELASVLTETESVRDAHQTELGRAVDRYRTAVLTGSPEVPPDLVTGATIDEVDASLARARTIVDHIARSLAGSTTPIPNGAPPRRPPDLASLTPLEKIRLGLTGG